MNRGIWLAAALLVGGPATAAESSTSDGTATSKSTTSTGKTGNKPDAKSSSSAKSSSTKPSSSKASGKSGSTKEAAGKGPQLDAAKVDAVIRAKRVYMFAIETCERPDRCDQVLRDGAETQFMQACLACTTQERCDTEKAAILDGSARGSTTPCQPQP